jgi:hypothetical protein
VSIEWRRGDIERWEQWKITNIQWVRTKNKVRRRLIQREGQRASGLRPLSACKRRALRNLASSCRFFGTSEMSSYCWTNFLCQPYISSIRNGESEAMPRRKFIHNISFENLINNILIPSCAHSGCIIKSPQCCHKFVYMGES